MGVGTLETNLILVTLATASIQGASHLSKETYLIPYSWLRLVDL